MGIDIEGGATMIARSDRIDEGGLAAAEEAYGAGCNSFQLSDAIRAYLAAASHADAAPVAWMRKWAFDGIEVMRMPKKDRPVGWQLHEVTSRRCFPSDVPLYAAPATPPAAGSVTDAPILAALIARGREYAKATIKDQVAENGERLTYEDSIVWNLCTALEAALAAAPVPPVVGKDADEDDGRQLAHRLADIARSLLARPPELRGPFKADEGALRRVAALPPATTKAKTDVRAALASSVPVGAAPSQPVQVNVKAHLGSPTAYSRDQLAKLAFVVFYSANLCAPENIAAVIKEIDTCSDDCGHLRSSICPKMERGEYCPFSLAEDLRQISAALFGPRDPSHYVASVFGPDAMPALSSIEAAPGWREPEGWKLVPVEPTTGMILAYNEVFEQHGIQKWANARLTWPAMLAAAPLPTALAGGKDNG